MDGGYANPHGFISGFTTPHSHGVNLRDNGELKILLPKT